MNAGAARAGGEAILFLHADSRLPEGFDGLVERALEDEETAGGAFSFALDEDTPFFRFITMTANFRSARMGIVFGDQAIFARTETFREVGGYPEQPLMEDYELIRRLRKRGRIALLEPPVTTSSRRWREVGAVRNTLLNVFVTWAYVLGVSPARLRGWYGRLTGEC
jgi:rSAM/selenodomain-associated transferase 2